IGQFDRVIWDETHFGNFANHYIDRLFYLDVHPPLGKLLITLVYWTFGYQGGFDFASGHEYPETVPFVAARCVQAGLGAGLVPVTFWLCLGMRLPTAGAWLAAGFVAADNAVIGVSRMVVLDSMLMLANAVAVGAFVCLRNSGLAPGSRKWCFHMMALGLALSLVCSIKVVGLLTLAVTGICMLSDLLCFRSSQPKQMSIAWFAHALTLSVIPAAVYLAGLLIHFHILQNYSPQSDHMGSDYLARSNNSAQQIQPLNIYSDSFVVLRASAYPFEYMSYYFQNDTDEHVLITRREFAIESYLGIRIMDFSGTEPMLAPENARDRGNADKSVAVVVRDGSFVEIGVPKTNQQMCIPGTQLPSSRGRLVEFCETNRLHDPHGKNTWQIAVSNQETPGHMNDRSKLVPVATKFRLKSIEHNCEVAIDYNHIVEETVDQQLIIPPYVFECVSGSQQGTVWSVEHQIATIDTPTIDLRQILTSKTSQHIVTYGRLMHLINSMLVTDPDVHSDFESSPLSWPFLTSPMPMGGWAGGLKYTLVGNPILWWASAIVCVIIHPLVVSLSLIISRRSHGKVVDLVLPWEIHFLWTMWAANYFVFFPLLRATYLHHYLPALYFSLLLLAFYICKGAQVVAQSLLSDDALPVQHRRLIGRILMGFAILVLLGTLYAYPLTFGTRYESLEDPVPVDDVVGNPACG
ncbi:Protein O-mannosyltransferase 2, partial [Kickxella alabastrina]